MITDCKIVTENVDIRDFWIDDRAKNINEAVDCIHEVYITYEEFLDMKLDKSYDTEKMD